MATVNSVLGPIDTGKLGFTLCHEHIIISSAGTRHTYPELIDQERIIEIAAEDLTRAHNEGVDTIVDVTTMDIGRDVSLIREISQRSGVQFICATGSWLDIPRDIAAMSPDRIASLWVREIEEGIEGTGIKAGIIKIATSDPIKAQEDLMLRAAAQAHKRTDVPITTHTQPLSRVGEQQIRIFEDEGIDPGRVCIGHVSHVLEMDYHQGIIKKGALLGMDTYFWSPQMEPSLLSDFGSTFDPCGGRSAPGWEERTAFLKELIDNGYGDRIMLSHDWVTVPMGIPSWYPTREQNPDGYLWITRGVLPRLRELGASEEAIHRLMVENPRRFFEGG